MKMPLLSSWTFDRSVHARYQNLAKCGYPVDVIYNCILKPAVVVFFEKTMTMCHSQDNYFIRQLSVSASYGLFYRINVAQQPTACTCGGIAVGSDKR